MADEFHICLRKKLSRILRVKDRKIDFRAVHKISFCIFRLDIDRIFPGKRYRVCGNYTLIRF